MHKEVILPPLQSALSAAPSQSAVVDLWHEVFAPAETEVLRVALQDQIAWRHDEIVMYGKAIPIPRLTAWYGDPGL